MVVIAHRWNFIKKGLLLQPAQQACFLNYPDYINCYTLLNHPATGGRSPARGPGEAATVIPHTGRLSHCYLLLNISSIPHPQTLVTNCLGMHAFAYSPFIIHITFV